MEASPVVTRLSSKWADPEPATVEVNVDSPVKSTENLAPAAPGEESKVPSIREPLEPTAGNRNTSTPALLDSCSQKSLPISRTQSPNPKSIRWKGKNVIIKIPANAPFGQPEEDGGRPIPLTPQQVEERMQRWIDQGYGVEISGGEDGGQNRTVYPAETRGKVDESEIFVSIPDRRDWEAYVEALREEKLRALGVILDDPPPPPPQQTNGSMAGTPLSYTNSPALVGNPFSPPPQPMSAMSNPMSNQNGYFNAFSPVSIPTNGTPVSIGGPVPGMPTSAAAVAPHMAFHLPRQSMSMNGTPTGVNEWGDPYSMFTPPPQTQPTPPSLGGSGMWSPPTWNNLRNGSPAVTHGHSPAVWNGGYPQPHDPKQFDQWGHYNPLVVEERFHQQQIRRGSPLAHSGYLIEQPEQEIREDLAIDAPIPKHRHQLSLKAYDGSENYNGSYQQGQLTTDGDGFATNPVSPAPISFPPQPEMPRMENEVPLGPEVASNPDEDISEEEEKHRNKKEIQDLEHRTEYAQNQYSPAEPMQQFMPHQQFPPRSREQSLSQMQRDYDAADPAQNSAMQMLMAGEGLNGPGHQRASLHTEEVLSEDGRTNCSDEDVTNPSEESSPMRKYSTISHGQHTSNTSSQWTPGHGKVLSGGSSNSKPKFNVNATEFKFDPAAAVTFAPKDPFSPTQQKEPPQDHTRDISAVSPSSAPFGNGAYSASFRPALVNSSTINNLFEKGAAAFGAGAPIFTKPSAPKPAIGSIFGGLSDIVKPPPTKKIIPIVRPPSRPQSQGQPSADEARDMREDSAPDGGRKRAKHSPTLDAVKDAEVAPLDSISDPVVKASDEAEAEKSNDDTETMQSDPAAIIGEAEDSVGSYEFKNKKDAEQFAIAAPRDESNPRRGSAAVRKDEGAAVLSPEQAAIAAAAALGLTPTPEKSPRTPSPVLPPPNEAPISEEKHKSFKKLTFNPTAKSFSFRPGTEEFNFNFDAPPPQQTAPAPRKFGGMGESRYAKSPSPPPTEPAPVPPVLGNGSAYLPHRAPTPYNAEPPKPDVLDDTLPRPIPTDAELDEVIMLMEEEDEARKAREMNKKISKNVEADGAESDEADRQYNTAPFKRTSRSPKRMTIPAFERPEPTPMAQRQLQNLRSDGPSPSPRRVDLDQFLRHRASSFSPDEDIDRPVHAITNIRPTDIGIAKDVDSDWDDMVSEKSEGKLRPQSRLFFDSHVEELVGGLLKERLDPVHKALVDLQDMLNTVSMQSAIKGFADHSDADDEDDHSVTLPSKSPRDRKLNILKAAVAETLAMHNGSSLGSDEKFQEIKDAISANEMSGEFEALKSAVVDAVAKAARQEDMAAVRASVEDVSMRIAQTSDLAELKNTIIDAMSAHAQIQDVAALRESLLEVISKATQRVDLVDIQLALQDIQQKAPHRGDIAEIKAAITNGLASAARKEDLVPLHNVLAEAFEKTAKTEDLTDFLNQTMDVLKTALGQATNSTRQDLQRVEKISENMRSSVAQILHLTQDYAENMDFHQEAQEGMIKDAQNLLATRSDNIQNSINEVQQYLQSRQSKTNQFEKEQRDNVSTMRAALAETMRLVQDGFRDMGRSHPTLDDFRSVVERLAGTQPQIGQFRHAFEEAVRALPGLVDFKATIEEVINSQPRHPGVEDFRQLMEEDRMLKAEQLRLTVEHAVKSQPTLQDYEKILEEAFHKHQLVVPLDFGRDEERKAATGESAEELKVKVRALEKALAQKEDDAAEEARNKRSWEEKAIEMETKLRMAEEESERLREVADEKDRRLRSIDDKRHQALTSAQMRSALLEGAHSSLQKSVGDLSARNAALEGSLREAKDSSERYKADNEVLEMENRELRRQIERVRAEMEESIRVREGFRAKFDNLQEGMRNAAQEFAQEQGKWRKLNEEQRAQIDVLEARLMSEATRIQGLENEVRRLEVTEKDAIRMRIELEQYQRANSKYDELVAQLRNETVEKQSRIAQLSHEVESVRDSARNEITHAQVSMQAQLDAANNQVNEIRRTLEKEQEEARHQIDEITQNAAVEKEKMELLLEEAADSKAAALKQADDDKARAVLDFAESKSSALQEQHRKYEAQIQDLRTQHERQYQMVTEDAERQQYFLRERLNMAQEEAQHLRDHIETLQAQVKTLNENFKIANVAAQAAAQAATAVREMSTPHLTEGKALLETVDVLQSQLQEREARIEALETEVASFDKNKIKEASSHLAMYRELLDMRIDDLEEIIHTCSLPQPDRGSLRDAATRLKATLEMQRHEQERAAGIVKDSPASGSPAIANIASKLPGVASAAWSNWLNRNKNNGSVDNNSPAQTPSRPSSAAGGLLNGILTPPNTSLNQRNGGGLASRFGRATSEGPTTGPVTNSVQSMSGKQRDNLPALLRGRHPAIGRAAPTQQLFRKGSYDADADSSVLDSSEFYDDESTVTETANRDDQPDMEPFGISPYARS